MFVYVLLALCALACFGSIACLLLRNPLTRSMEERHGLGDMRRAVERAVEMKGEERARREALRVQEATLRRQLVEMERELALIEEELRLIPEQRYAYMFELGTRDGRSHGFDFVISRAPRKAAGGSQSIEGRLWAHRHPLRVWATNETAALQLAQARYSQVEGFSVRRADPGSVPAATLA